MSIGEKQLTWFTQGLSSADTKSRYDATEAVEDWLEHLDVDEAGQIGRILAQRATTTTGRDELESVTHALHALAQWDLLPQEVLEAAAELPDSGDQSVATYVGYLRTRAAGADQMGHLPGDPTADPAD